MNSLTENQRVQPFTNNVVIFSDSIVNFNGKIKYKQNKGLQSGKARFKTFPGTTSKDLLHYIDRTLDHSIEVAIIHIGINNIINHRNSPGFAYVLKNIRNIVLKCRSYAIEHIFISELLTKTRMTDNTSIKDICKVEKSFYVSNDNN